MPMAAPQAPNGFASMFGGGSGGAPAAGGGIGGVRSFLEGPYMDFTEGLGSFVAATKGNEAYSTFLAEKRSKRTRMRFDAALAPMEMVVGAIAKNPQLAKLFMPGGAYDDWWPNQRGLIRATSAAAGLDGDAIADQYEMLFKMSATLPEADTRTPLEKDIATLEGGLGRPLSEQERLKAGGALVEPEKPQRDVEIDSYTGSDGHRYSKMQKPDGTTYEIRSDQRTQQEGSVGDSVALKRFQTAVKAAGVDPNKAPSTYTQDEATRVQAQLSAQDPLRAAVAALVSGKGEGGAGVPSLDAIIAGQNAEVGGEAAGRKVGDKITVDGVEATVTEVLPDGKLKVRTANGRTGTVTP